MELDGTKSRKNYLIRRQWKRLFVFCFCFFLCFSAYFGLRDILSSLNVSHRGSSFASLTVLYATSLVAGLTMPAVVRCKLGTKWGLVLGFSLHVAYTAANFFVSPYLLLPASLLPGFGAALVWVSRGTYITVFAMEMAALKRRNSVIDVGMFNGIFYMVSNFSGVCGNLISSSVLHFGEGDSQLNVTLLNADRNTSLCGMRACGNDAFESQSALVPPDPGTRNLLLSVYVGCGVLSVLLVVVILDKVSTVQSGRRLSCQEEEATEAVKSLTTKEEILSNIAATFRLMTHHHMARLIPALFFLGVDIAFVSGHFTKFFVGCTQGIEVVGYVMMSVSVSCGLFSLLIGRLLKFSRLVPFVVGSATYLMVLIVMLVWDPVSDRLWHLFALAIAVGFSRAVISTTNSTLLGMLFTCQSEAAFGNLCFWQSLGFAAIFALGIPQFICAFHVIAIVICLLLLVTCLFCSLELQLSRERRREQCGSSIVPGARQLDHVVERSEEEEGNETTGL